MITGGDFLTTTRKFLPSILAVVTLAPRATAGYIPAAEVWFIGKSLRTVGVVLLLILFGADAALASTFERAIELCRDRVGRPIVQTCMNAQGKGAEFEACRAEASPRVRTCVQKTMIATQGRANVQQAIEHCRQTVGRPIVQTCMNSQGKGAAFEACRAEASPKVRACVRESMIDRYGRANFQQAIEHCRQTEGRPIFQACMGGRRAAVKGESGGADLETCRAKASPKVRACVQKKIMARLRPAR